MKLKIIISFLFLLANQLFFGQNKVVDSCDLNSKNIQWKASFENEATVEMKLKLIREKIISDSIYRQYKPKIITKCTPTLYSESIDRNGNNCGVKILFSLDYRNKKSINLDLNKNPEYIYIVEKLNENNIQKVYPIFGTDAQTLYGSFGKSGAFILTTENRKFRKEITTFIRKIKKENKKPNG